MTLDKLSNKLEKTLPIAKFVIQILVSIGVLAIILYCGSIDYFPKDVTIGDGILFIAASLATSFTYAILVVALFSAGIVISPFIRWTQLVAHKFFEKINPNFTMRPLNFPHLGWDMLAVVIFGLIIIFIIALKSASDLSAGFGLLSGVLFMGLAYGFLNTKPYKPSPQNHQFNKNAKIICVSAIIPLVVMQSQGEILNQAMRLIGVRNENATILISEKQTEFLKENNISPDKIIGKNGAIYKEVVILFQGIGSNTVIEIKGTRLIVPTNELTIAFKTTKNNHP